MADTYVLVNSADTVVDCIVWDGDPSHWQPPPGIRAFKHDGAWRDGWKCDGSKVYDPNPTPPPTPPAKGMTVL